MNINVRPVMGLAQECKKEQGRENIRGKRHRLKENSVM